MTIASPSLLIFLTGFTIFPQPVLAFLPFNHDLTFRTSVSGFSDVAVSGGVSEALLVFKDGVMLGGVSFTSTSFVYDNFQPFDGNIPDGEYVFCMPSRIHDCSYPDGAGLADNTGRFSIIDGAFYPKVIPVICTENCFSNVLFLPGLKGSNLMKGNDHLWPPTVFSVNDTSQLSLSGDGESVNDVYTDGILKTFLGTQVYGSFSDFMDDLVSEDKLINEWLPLAYDWRFSPDKILEDGIKTEDETLDVIDEIEKLAESSRTGKVTIVSHSMGGLMGKAIIKRLDELGRSALVDSFVMVGTPQLGTPQAIASILHGDGEGILGNFIVDGTEIRKIAQNMPGAYNLLPSSRYFDEVSDPVINFDSSADFTKDWRDFWGDTINIYSSFLSFMTGSGVARTSPEKDEMETPEVLKSDLMTDAKNFHDEYDNYQFPDHIRVVQIAGWGLPTVKNVEYTNSHDKPSYNVNFTVEGDRTVVYPSATSSVVDETLFFNIFDFNDFTEENIQHRDLLNSSVIQDLMKLVFENKSIEENDFFTKSKPSTDDVDQQLVVSTFSPVILGAYDELGNFTGINPSQNLSQDILIISEEIPGSAFIYTAESQNIFLPKQGNYEFVYKGIGNGPTTLEIKNFSVDVTTPIISYTDVPTTTTTLASFELASATPEKTILKIDANNDGEIDNAFSPDGTEPSLVQLLDLIKQKIQGLSAKDKLKQSLLKKVESIEKKIEDKAKNNKKVSSQSEKGKINVLNATELTNLIILLEASAEESTALSKGIADVRLKIYSLTVPINIKIDFLKRVEKLEKKQVLIKSLSSVSKKILNKPIKGKILEPDGQVLLNLLTQIEAVI